MPDHSTPSVEPTGDPWHAFGYLVSGVLVYGFLGWAADRWLGTSWLVVVGILLGAAMGIYMTWARFNKPFHQLDAPHADQKNADDQQNDTGELR